MRTSTLFFFFFIGYHAMIMAQEEALTQIYGTIKDSKTGESLPFVDIYFVGTDIGQTSDIDGNYFIETNRLLPVDSIGFSFLGFQRKHYKINLNQKQEINIALTVSENDLVTATVTTSRKKAPKDTAAIALWRQVVAHRATNMIEAAASYEYQEYVQTGFDLYNPDPKIINMKILQKPFGVVKNYIQTEDTEAPFLPFLLKETLSDVHYQKNPKRKKVNILADRFSGMDNPSLSDFISNELSELNPYLDLIILTGKSFISPFAGTADLSYNYFLSDSLVKDGQLYYLLTFVGKTQQDYTFLGGAWIQKATFAIESIEMEISPHINLNFIKKLQTSQYYSPTPEGVWVKTKETLVTKLALDLFDFGSRKNEKKKKNQFRIRKTLTRHHIKINQPIPNEKFKIKTAANEEGLLYNDEAWDTLRPISLNPIDQGTYEMVDSIQRTKFYKTMDWFLYMAITSHFRAGPIEFGEYPEFFSWNDLEGYRVKLGVRTSKKLSDKFQVYGFAAYGFKDQEWKYGTGFKYMLPSKNKQWNMISVDYQYDFQMLGQKLAILRHDNIFNSISRRTPMSRLMKIREAKVAYEKEWFKGFSSNIGYRWRTFYSVEGAFEFTQNNGQTAIPSFKTSEFQLGLHWGHDERFFTDNSGFKRSSMGGKFPIFHFNYTLGVKNFLGGEHHYHKLDLSIRQRFSSPLGYTKYNIELSKAFGEVPYPAMTVHLGNQSIMGNRFAYALMNEFEFESDSYASIWVSHHFDGLILNKIPLINKLKWRSLFIFKGLYGTISDKNRAVYDIPRGVSAPGFYAEIGFGIENIFKVLRVDFMWRLTHLDNPDVRSFGVNISISPKF